MLIKFQTDWTKHFANIGDIAILNSLLCIRRDRRAVWKIVGRLSEVKLVTSLLASSGNAGNLKLFWFQVHSELQRKTTQNPKLAL